MAKKGEINMREELRLAQIANNEIVLESPPGLEAPKVDPAPRRYPDMMTPAPASDEVVVPSGKKLKFSEAFSQARAAGLKAFEWEGEQYSTKLKEEMPPPAASQSPAPATPAQAAPLSTKPVPASATPPAGLADILSQSGYAVPTPAPLTRRSPDAQALRDATGAERIAESVVPPVVERGQALNYLKQNDPEKAAIAEAIGQRPGVASLPPSERPPNASRENWVLPETATKEDAAQWIRDRTAFYLTHSKASPELAEKLAYQSFVEFNKRDGASAWGDAAQYAESGMLKAIQGGTLLAAQGPVPTLHGLATGVVGLADSAVRVATGEHDVVTKAVGLHNPALLREVEKIRATNLANRQGMVEFANKIGEAGDYRKDATTAPSHVGAARYDKAEGVGETLEALLDHPPLLANMLAEQVPMVFGSMVGAKLVSAPAYSLAMAGQQARNKLVPNLNAKINAAVDAAEARVRREAVALTRGQLAAKVAGARETARAQATLQANIVAEQARKIAIEQGRKASLAKAMTAAAFAVATCMA